jgi:hypothetical protein
MNTGLRRGRIGEQERKFLSLGPSIIFFDEGVGEAGASLIFRFPSVGTELERPAFVVAIAENNVPLTG